MPQELFCTTTRSLSVSFQGESFFYQTSKAKTNPPVPARKPTPSAGDPTPAKTPVPYYQVRLRIRSQQSITTAGLRLQLGSQTCYPRAWIARQRSRNFFNSQVASSNDVIRQWHRYRQCIIWEQFWDPVLHLPRQARVSSQGVSMPARFWQETNSRIRSLPRASHATGFVRPKEFSSA
ncbi:hypothetical protein HPP92_007664 [Vanilla planifolia]|uniref:Uncharacterized protein n=1 Tax=Vanilla planifolia TaxID=51239 RepID=A0A835RKX4_VANPL|nr:hypothetical protein HPP92_007664 [Vanilla planifolia]